MTGTRPLTLSSSLRRNSASLQGLCDYTSRSDAIPTLSPPHRPFPRCPSANQPPCLLFSITRPSLFFMSRPSPASARPPLPSAYAVRTDLAFSLPPCFHFLFHLGTSVLWVFPALPSVSKPRLITFDCFDHQFDWVSLSSIDRSHPFYLIDPIRCVTSVTPTDTTSATINKEV